ncbi:MAG: GIY-YIG nuclease family protein [Candidatus Kuenenbacteria bacterium]
MYYVYILFCSDKTYYVGLTKNIKKRILEHKNSLVDYTKYNYQLKLFGLDCLKIKKLP